MLVGRHAETKMIETVLEQARNGRSSVLIISGEPGIGKSALLAHAGDATDGIVLSATGVPEESDLAYVHLADLFRTVEPALDDFPAPQADALASVLAIGPARPADRFTVAAATLTLLGALAGSGPVTVLVDDAQWLDPASLEVLTFVAHRLNAEGVALLFGVRAGHERGLRLSRFPSLTLRGLTQESARTLLATSARDLLNEAFVNRVLVEAAGNPLALLALPRLLTPVQLAMWIRGRDPLPIDSLLEQAFCGGLRDLPATTREAVILLAVLGRAPRGVLELALAARGLGLDHLEPAERMGLIVDHGEGPTFRHALVRAAVFQTSLPSQRRQAHLTLAAVLEVCGLPHALEQRAWHLVAAGGMADETVAAELERAAREEFAVDNFAVAGSLFLRSADLTPEGGPKAERLIRAAKSIRLTGGIAESYVLLSRALNHTVDPRVVLAVRYSMCRIDMWRAPTVDGRDTLLELVAAVLRSDPAQAAAMLTDAALASVEIGDMTQARAASAQAMDLRSPDSGPPALPVLGVRAMVLGLSGDTQAVRSILGPRTAEIQALDPLSSEAADQLALVISLALLSIEETDQAHALLSDAVAGARRHSAVGLLPFRLGRMAWVQYWQGRWSAARATTYEALQLAEDTGWLNERPSSLATLARVEAVTGRVEECRRHAAEAIATARQLGGWPYVAYAHTCLGLLELTLGHHLTAIEAFSVMDEFAAERGIADTPVLWWSGDLIEAYLGYGLPNEAAAVLERLERAVANHPVPTAAAVASRSRALLQPDDFDQHIAQAMAWHQKANMPFERARTELALGRHLRRHRLRSEAREPLRTALNTFERLGAPDWAERARRELQATGARQTRRPAGSAELTPQELQVALAVSQGLSNRQVAAQLFLSVKTVEFHLSHAYDKFGIHRRSQLARAVAPLDTV